MSPEKTSIAAKQVVSAIPHEIKLGLEEIGPVISQLQTAALYAPLHAGEPYAGIKAVRDISYGTHDRNVLDLFTSGQSLDAVPVLVFIHGGGFTGGNKSAPLSPFYDNVMLWAARHGMIGVNATYRLAPDHQWPSVQQDLGRVMKWVNDHIKEYGGDASRVFLVGHSAGAAHVAQYIGHPQFHTVAGGGVAGAMLLSGIFDLERFSEKAMAESYFGNDPVAATERCALPGLGKTAMPLFFAYAEHDPGTFREQTIKAAQQLGQDRSGVVLVELVGHNHLSEVYGINTGDQGLSRALLAFMKESQTAT